MRSRFTSSVLLASGLLLVPEPAFAYVGPGAGLTVIGAAVALIGAVFLGLFGFIWYPVKRLFRRGSAGSETP